MDTFRFFCHELPYIQQNRPASEGGWPHIGERTIEIPIGKLWLGKRPYGDLVEVGAVMPWFWYAESIGHQHDPVPVPRIVVDPWDDYSLCTREDGEVYPYRDKYVLSISTLEHIGLTEYGNRTHEADKAARVLNKIMAEAKGHLLDWPLGHNRNLDEALRGKCACESGFSVFMLKQVSPDNRWSMADVDWSSRYDAPYRFGNGVVFVTDSLAWICGE